MLPFVSSFALSIDTFRCLFSPYLKGHVVPVSLPAVQGSVFSSSGCVTDGMTALTEQMNRLVATPPILLSVSPGYL